jgi:hypothetical protein
MAMETHPEQVRSIACALTGDLAGARRVELTLPATGTCSGPPSDSRVLASVAADSATACCGGPAPAEVDACCAQDAEAKAGGQVGCGCGSEHLAEAASVPSSAVPGGPQRSAPQLLAIGALRKDPRASSCCS